MKTLEAWCKAKGYQGGHVFMMIEDLTTTNISKESDPYKWGCREALELRNGWNICDYSVPVNSWEDSTSTIEYLKGLHDTLESEWKLTQPHLGIDDERCVDPRF